MISGFRLIRRLGGDTCIGGLPIMRVDVQVTSFDRKSVPTEFAGGEVDDALGVKGLAHVAGFEVEMRAGASSGTAAQADGLAGADNLPFFH